jgi:hypothetical protein
MKTDEILLDRLSKLIDFEAQVMLPNGKHLLPGETMVVFGNQKSETADTELGTQWGISCLNLIKKVFWRK